MTQHTRRAILLVLMLLAAGVRADTLAPMRVVDLDGQPRTLVRDDARATAIVFLGTQCPISNRDPHPERPCQIPLLTTASFFHRRF